MIYSVVLPGRIPGFRDGGAPPFQRTSRTRPTAPLHPAPCEREGGVTHVGLLRWKEGLSSAVCRQINV